jgi:hypothetical protein
MSRNLRNFVRIQNNITGGRIEEGKNKRGNKGGRTEERK